MAKEQLNAKQERFLQALLASETNQEAITASGIPERTAYSWLRTPKFQAAYKEARGLLFDETMRELTRSTKDAIATLRRHATAKGIRPTSATQIRAAQLLLEKAIEIEKMQELETRLADLEARFKDA